MIRHPSLILSLLPVISSALSQSVYISFILRGYVAKIFTSEKSVKPKTPVSSEKSGKFFSTSDSSATPPTETVTPKKVSSLNNSRSSSVEKRVPSAEIIGTPASKKKSTPVAEGRKTPITGKKVPAVNVEIRSINGKKSSSRDVYEMAPSSVPEKKVSSPGRGKETSSPVLHKKV